MTGAPVLEQPPGCCRCGKQDETPVVVLALSGGGIRGLVQVEILSAIETELRSHVRARVEQQRVRHGLPIAQHPTFEVLVEDLADWPQIDLVAGTSTGAISAALLGSLGLKLGVEVGRELYSDPHVVGRIFPSSLGAFGDRLRARLRGDLSVPRYPVGLAEVLRENLEGSFGSLRYKTLVTAWHTGTRLPVAWKSWRAEFQEARLAELVQASASAPTYFPATVARSLADRGPYVDGGLWANDPSIAALVEARRLYGDRPVHLISVGTGYVPQAGMDRILSAGPLRWAPSIIQTLMEAPEAAVAYQCRQLLGERYLSLCPALPRECGAMDDASPANLQRLVDSTRRWIEGPGRYSIVRAARWMAETTLSAQSARSMADEGTPGAATPAGETPEGGGCWEPAAATRTPSAG